MAAGLGGNQTFPPEFFEEEKSWKKKVMYQLSVLLCFYLETSNAKAGHINILNTFEQDWRVAY